jgi:hypothetical protein
MFLGSGSEATSPANTISKMANPSACIWSPALPAINAPARFAMPMACCTLQTTQCGTGRTGTGRHCRRHRHNGLGARYLLITTVMASEKSWLPFRLVRANCGARTRACPMRLPVQGGSQWCTRLKITTCCPVIVQGSTYSWIWSEELHSCVSNLPFLSRENMYAIVTAVDAIIAVVSHRRYRLVTSVVLFIVILKKLALRYEERPFLMWCIIASTSNYITVECCSCLVIVSYCIPIISIHARLA